MNSTLRSLKLWRELIADQGDDWIDLLIMTNDFWSSLAPERRSIEAWDSTPWFRPRPTLARGSGKNLRPLSEVMGDFPMIYKEDFQP